ncbi:hypothetical protein GCM10023074_46230 [Microbispora amethystogenes]|uniref:Uncharacterized protein n=1 Tax=Microbispora amethystogenes TaxID=1427754 RepID=A0ABQ4FER9_9ACTN|nr:hypothetical protein Mam01_34760 [Microbispora amethystogenes]
MLGIPAVAFHVLMLSESAALPKDGVDVETCSSLRARAWFAREIDALRTVQGRMPPHWSTPRVRTRLQ